MDSYNYTFEAPQMPQPPQRPHRNRLGLLIVSLCLVFTLIGGALGGVTMFMLLPQLTEAPAQAQEAAAVQPEQSATQPSSKLLTPTASTQGSALTPKQIYEKCNTSVVAISTETTGVNVFGQRVSQASAGSGFIITEDGYVVTNNHVIESANSISVVLSDGTEYDAKLIGGDSKTDLAILKIEATGLNAAVLGDSSQMTVGDPVVAIGNPLGELNNSLTSGVVSAVNRDFATSDGTQNMLQTDAAINPGNSGGPLINDRGEVIGITTAKYASAEIEGLGFAIPSNDAKPILDVLIESGYVTGRPMLGVSVQTISQYDVQQYGVPQGAYVTLVESGSAAEKAGIAQGDIITKLGDTKITNISELNTAKNAYKAGETVSIEIYRYDEKNPQTMTLQLTFDEDKPTAPTENSQQTAPWRVPSPSGSGQ